MTFAKHKTVFIKKIDDLVNCLIQQGETNESIVHRLSPYILEVNNLLQQTEPCVLHLYLTEYQRFAFFAGLLQQENELIR